MFREEKNLKDSIKDTTSVPAPLPPWRDGSGSYTKTNKLITALYMVTDIIDKDEPLRNKLRTLGVEILSDTNSFSRTTLVKIDTIFSLLDIASAINIISEMNCNILRKEFLELNESIKESANTNSVEMLNGQINLAEFFANSKEEELPLPNLPLHRGRSEEGVLSLKGERNSKGHMRLGVQKGSTLLKAIKDMSVKVPTHYENENHRSDFDILKKQRREEIINFIKKNGGNATITDIRNGALRSLVSCSEKTLQRELVSMVRDGVLDKTGEKRWSRYKLGSSS